MARKYTLLTKGVFNEILNGAGILLKSFDPTGETQVSTDDILCDTTGDITVTCVPTYSDMGEDVNNCPNGVMELMNLDHWENRIAFTALNFTLETTHLSLGAADIDTETGKVTPRSTLDTTKDFKDVWLVVDKGSKKGFVAIHLKNALSTAGLSITTTKTGKGQLQIELSGHVSVSKPDEVPLEIYVSEDDEAA